MKDLIQNLLIYIILVSALRGLVSNPKYQQYFQFFSGMILILFLITPVLQLFQGEEAWFNTLEQKLLQMDLADIQQEMAVAEESFSKMVTKEYQAAVEEQAQALAAQKGVTLEDVEIILTQENEEITVEEIHGTVVKNENTSEQQWTDTKDQIAIPAIQIGEQKKKSTAGKKDTSKEAASLRREFANYFMIREEQVHLWK